MAEEPQLPPIPSITDDWDRKKRFVEKKHSVIKCGECQESFSRLFKPGDYVFKKLPDEKCEKCNKTNTLIIIEIFGEWVDPKKNK
jgi:hypothetical protein